MTPISDLLTKFLIGDDVGFDYFDRRLQQLKLLIQEHEEELSFNARHRITTRVNKHLMKLCTLELEQKRLERWEDEVATISALLLSLKQF